MTTTPTHAAQNLSMSQSPNFEQTIIFTTIMEPREQTQHWLAVIPPEVPSGE